MKFKMSNFDLYGKPLNLSEGIYSIIKHVLWSTHTGFNVNIFTNNMRLSFRHLKQFRDYRCYFIA